MRKSYKNVSFKKKITENPFMNELAGTSGNNLHHREDHTRLFQFRLASLSIGFTEVESKHAKHSIEQEFWRK